MADILQGTSSGTWGKPDKGTKPNPKLYQNPPDTFEWGKPVRKSYEPNGLIFTGGGFAEEIGKPFEVGKLNYYNGSIFVNTAVESVPLKIELDLDSPTDRSTTFTFDLDLDTTDDRGKTDDDAKSDFVYFPDVLPSQTFTYDGTKYTLELVGFSKDEGKTLENRFRVRERQGDLASLFAKITKAPPKLADLEDPTADTDGAINIGNLNQQTKGYRKNEEIGFTEGGVRDLQDFYKFTLSSESEVNLTLDQLKRNANVEIVDKDGSTVLFQSTEANRTREEITENLEAGTYFVRVYPEGDDRTKYRLSVSAEELVGEKDKIATAKELGSIGLEEVSEADQIGFGRGKNRDEQDYYKFSISEKSEIFLTLDQLKKDANVQIFDSDGKSLLFQSLNKGRKAEKISEDLDAGDYFVKVFPQGNAKTDYRLGLSANVIVEENDDEKPGIALGAVTELSPVKYSGNLGRGRGRRRDQVDWYTFDQPVEGTLNLTLDKLRADLNVEIFDEGGELVEEGKNKGRKAEKIEIEGLEAGTYSVKVSPNGSAKTNYRLGITTGTPYVDDYPTPETALDFGAIAPGEKRVFNNEMGRTVGRSGRDTQDWIRFEIDKDNFVGIDLGRLRQDINMTLYDDDGETILNNAREKGRANENISVFLLEGTYYVKVVPKGSARSDYRLTVNTGGNPPPIFEIGDIPSLEEGSYSNTDRIGFTSSGFRNTIDRYEFSVGKESDVDIFLSQLRGDANIRLFDSDGKTLLFDSFNKGRQDEEISETLEAGDYFLHVIAQNAAKTGYLLDIIASEAIDPNGGPVPETSLYTDIGTLIQDYTKVDRVGFGNGSNRDQADYYRFILSEEKSLSITLKDLTDNINLELLDGSGSKMFDSRNRGKRNEKIEEDLEAGTYFIGVKPQGSARGDYTLDITGTGPGSGVDPDGGQPPENVTDIGVLTEYSENDSIGARENGYRDVNDYRKFTLNEQSSVDINLTNLKANADLELIDSDGRTLLKRSARGGSGDENVNVTLDKGEYYTRVLPKGAASTAYELNMSASGVGGTIDDEPPGGDLGTVGADPLTQGGLIGFKEGGVVDTSDYYNFVVSSSRFVNVELDGLSGNANLELYDSKGKELIGSSTNSGNSSEEIEEFLSADTYVVRVFGQGSQTPYDLSVSI